ncbi:hypothetical protein OA498_03965 [Candidatus Pelagibacter bacterium]|nr:hypothetical protein [Candidatus Pelagibacter bacterium]
MPKKTKRKKVKKNYFNKFWDGELSLPVSYWLFGLVYSILVGILIVFLAILMGFPDRAWGVLILPWTIFWAVGCWRSCKNYKGKIIWPILAKISIVLALIQGVVDATVGI